MHKGKASWETFCAHRSNDVASLAFVRMISSPSTFTSGHRKVAQSSALPLPQPAPHVRSYIHTNITCVYVIIPRSTNFRCVSQMKSSKHTFRNTNAKDRKRTSPYVKLIGLSRTYTDHTFTHCTPNTYLRVLASTGKGSNRCSLFPSSTSSSASAARVLLLAHLLTISTYAQASNARSAPAQSCSARSNVVFGALRRVRVYCTSS
jgi:hypothetical protein